MCAVHDVEPELARLPRFRKSPSVASSQGPTASALANAAIAASRVGSYPCAAQRISPLWPLAHIQGRPCDAARRGARACCQALDGRDFPTSERRHVGAAPTCLSEDGHRVDWRPLRDKGGVIDLRRPPYLAGKRLTLEDTIEWFRRRLHRE
jgi:hypothetical protein